MESPSLLFFVVSRNLETVIWLITPYAKPLKFPLVLARSDLGEAPVEVFGGRVIGRLGVG